jgi:hypothetical protein
MASCAPDLALEMASEEPLPNEHHRAATEARWFYRGIGRNGQSLASIRAAIVIPADVERELQTFAKRRPEEAWWVEQALAYRRAVLAAFDRLVAAAAPAASPCVASADPLDEEFPTARDREAAEAFQQELAAAERFRTRLLIW